MKPRLYQEIRDQEIRPEKDEIRGKATGFDYEEIWEENRGLNRGLNTGQGPGPGTDDDANVGVGVDGHDRQDGEELHGTYETDESDAPAMRKGSFLFRLRKITDGHHQDFLKLPPITRGDALREMNSTEKMIFEFLIILTPLFLLAKIWQFPQKSVAWLWARKGRITGSTTGTAVGHQRGKPILTAAYESCWVGFKGNQASRWGSGKEVYATQCYANDLQRLVTEVFRAQRKAGDVQRNGYFIFRNQPITVQDINRDPRVEVRHYGLLIDPWNHQRGVSPDGVIFINGQACGVLEVKCAYSKDKSLYINIKEYYYTQLMSELYLTNIYWPTIKWLDFVVWSPEHFTVDTYTFDARFYFTWYGPRELKYYFRLYLKATAEKVYMTTQQETNNPLPSAAEIRRTIERDFTMPNVRSTDSTAPDTTSGTGQFGPTNNENNNNTDNDNDPTFTQALIDLDIDLQPINLPNNSQSN
jgi:hypothetical protein